MTRQTLTGREQDGLRVLNTLIVVLTCALFGGLAWAFTTQPVQVLLEVIRSQP